MRQQETDRGYHQTFLRKSRPASADIQRKVPEVTAQIFCPASNRDGRKKHEMSQEVQTPVSRHRLRVSEEQVVNLSMLQGAFLAASRTLQILRVSGGEASIRHSNIYYAPAIGDRCWASSSMKPSIRSDVSYGSGTTPSASIAFAKNC
jgi:hypothetical protein